MSALPTLSFPQCVQPAPLTETTLLGTARHAVVAGAPVAGHTPAGAILTHWLLPGAAHLHRHGCLWAEGAAWKCGGLALQIENENLILEKQFVWTYKMHD